MRILSLDQIREILPSVDLVREIEAGFVAYSNGRAVIPPVGELIMKDPPGDVHIKYGYLTGDDYYVIKVASGFYDNPKIGLPSNNGLMLLFQKSTGVLAGIILDEGYLTDVRTAAAGAIAAKYLAPSEISCIGVFGTGVQARLQLEYLKAVTPCREIIVWGRNEERLQQYSNDMASHGFAVTTTLDSQQVLQQCQLIVTTTASSEPVLSSMDGIEHGVHITAVGSDTPHKRELDAATMQRADLVVADSISQCLTRGEIHRALADGVIRTEDLVEFGDVISAKNAGRTSEQQVTVADLTGVAVQDIQIAKAVFETAEGI